ncbi:hypothetical protein FXO37_12588 [Capsicum annuum]|nr:hypothetical protein FXO37_12588 [Capsicum annuum]
MSKEGGKMVTKDLMKRTNNQTCWQVPVQMLRSITMSHQMLILSSNKLLQIIAIGDVDAHGSDSDNPVATAYFGMIDEVHMMLVSQINNIAIEIVDLLKCKECTEFRSNVNWKALEKRVDQPRNP